SAVSHSSAVPANIFCVTCASLICSACQQSSEHADHSTCEFGQANMRLLRWLLSIADSLESLANRLARIRDHQQSAVEVRADFSILYARLISAENDAVCRLRQSGVLAPLAQQKSEQLLAELLRRCADWLLPLSLSLKALSLGWQRRHRSLVPGETVRLCQAAAAAEQPHQPACLCGCRQMSLPVSSAGASAAASMPQLCRRSDTQPLPASQPGAGIEHLLANSPAGIFCDSGLLEQPSVQQESLSNPLPKAAVVAEEADSAAPTTMPVPLSTGDAVIPLFLLSPREIWVARYAEQAWLKRTQQLCSQAAKSQLAVQTENCAKGMGTQPVPERLQTGAELFAGETLVDLLIRVVLHDCDLRFLSVRELLVFANLACYAMPYLHNREASNDLVDTEAPRLFLRVIDSLASVSAFYSPDEFYVFRCNQGADMDVFEEMQQALQVPPEAAERHAATVHVFNFLCMDTPSTVDPNSDGLPTVPVGVYELNTPVPICPFKREHGRGVTVLARAQPATRGSRVKAAAQSVGKFDDVAIRMCPTRDRARQQPRRQWMLSQSAENYQLLEPWLAKLVLTGKLDHAACTLFSPRNNNFSAETAATGCASDRTGLRVRKPNLLWYRLSAAFSDPKSYNTPANAIFEITRQSTTGPLCRPWLLPCACTAPYSAAGGQRLDSHLREAMRSHLARREYFAHMCAPPPPSHERGGLNNGLPMQSVRQQRACRCRPVAGATAMASCNRPKQHAASCEGVALARHVEPCCRREAAYINAWAEAKNFCVKKNATNNLRLPRREAAATADALKSSNLAEQMPQCDISAAKEDATPQQMQRQQPKHCLTNQIRTMSSNLTTEFLLKPSDEDGDWVIGDPSPPSAAAAAPPAAAAAPQKTPQPPRPPAFVTAEAANSKPEAEVEAEPRSGGGAEPKLGSGSRQNRKREPEADSRTGKVEADAEPEVEAEADPEAEADNAVAKTTLQPCLRMLCQICLPFVLWADQFRWPNIQVGPLREPIQAKLSHLDCSDERMVIYMQRSDERSEALLTRVAPCAAHLSYAQYDFDVLVEDLGEAVMPTGNMRPVFDCEGLTDPEHFDSHTFRDWRPYQKTIGALLTSQCQTTRLHCTQSILSGPTNELLCLASIVLLPDNREISQELMMVPAVACIETRNCLKWL
uniref:B box-type domain-containing protein n=1 Tax=Macrostomum lignano TaxID=282301 RepID=A0A1I8F754_9PLAT